MRLRPLALVLAAALALAGPAAAQAAVPAPVADVPAVAPVAEAPAVSAPGADAPAARAGFTMGVTVDRSRLIIGETARLTVTFSEPVFGGLAGATAAENASISGFTTTDYLTWTATLTPNIGVMSETNRVRVNLAAFLDSEGTPGVGWAYSANYEVYTARTSPSVRVESPLLNRTSVSPVTLTFSIPVPAIPLEALTVPNARLTGLATSDGGLNWRGTLIPESGFGGSTEQITLDVGALTDRWGNEGRGVATSNPYTIDMVAPEVRAFLMTSTSLLAGQSTTVRLFLTEPVLNLTVANLSSGQGTVTNMATDDDGSTWTATFTPHAELALSTASIMADLSQVTDHAGNPFAENAITPNFEINTVRPKATVTVTRLSLGIGATAEVRVDFGEVVHGIGPGVLEAPHATLSDPVSSDGGWTWHATLTPNDGVAHAISDVRVDLTAVYNAAGNRGQGQVSSAPLVIDTLAPTAGVVFSRSALTSEDSATVTITFSEPITGLALDAFDAPHVTASGLTSADGGTTWTLTLSPESGVEAEGNVLRLDLTDVRDHMHNSGSGSVESAPYSVNTLVDPTPEPTTTGVPTPEPTTTGVPTPTPEPTTTGVPTPTPEPTTTGAPTTAPPGTIPPSEVPTNSPLPTETPDAVRPPEPSETPGSTAPASSDPSATPAPALPAGSPAGGPSALAATGPESGPALLLGALMVFLGAAAVSARRRTRAGL